MDRTNSSNTLHLSEGTSQSFGALCHILLVLWFTAFLIMIADVLLLRDAWLRTRNRRLYQPHHFPYHLRGRVYEMVEFYEEDRPIFFLRVPRFPYQRQVMQMNGGAQYMPQRFPNGERVLMRDEEVEDVGERDVEGDQMEEHVINER